MTEFAAYPMALYSLKGEMRIVQDEQEHLDVLAAWEEAEAPDDESGDPEKRGPGRPRKNP